MKNESVEIDWKAIENSDPQELHVLKTPEYSEWICYLFGGEHDSGIGWRPLKGQHPNWFWRKMQYLMFGNNWVKDE